MSTYLKATITPKFEAPPENPGITEGRKLNRHGYKVNENDIDELKDVETSRNREVKELCAFQRRALSSLEEELTVIDKDIACAEALIVEVDNRVQALRGLVRKRCAKDPTFADSRQYNSGSRARLSQRRWREFSDSSRNIDTSDLKSMDADEMDNVRERMNGDQLIRTVGMVYSEFSKRYEAPRQSFQGPAGKAIVSLRPDVCHDLCHHLNRIAPSRRIWLVYWLDRNAGFWREMVRPPRALGGWRVGVFATRSPHRPTPVGLSLAEVTAVDTERFRIHVRGVDILDETPLLAWKVYDPKTESHVQTRSGWLEDKDKLQPLYYDEVSISKDIEDSSDDKPCRKIVDVLMTAEVRRKLEFVDAKTAIDIFSMLQAALSRVVRSGNNLVSTLDGRSERRPRFDGDEAWGNVYPAGAWRLWYNWDEDQECVRLINVSSGIRPEVLQDEGTVDREVREHKEFLKMFGCGWDSS
jgi:tRNA-Thr(GGU) m(6)t(6)A37 methyltransferase TsaA